MKSTTELVAEYESKLKELLDRTDASRVTLRLDLSEHRFYVDDVAAEARKPGVLSLKGETSLDQRKLSTVMWLDREHRLLVQRDLRSADPAPPEELVRVYGTMAQMLGPLVRDGTMVGWVSVHENNGPRDWKSQDIFQLEEAIDWFQRKLAGT